MQIPFEGSRVIIEIPRTAGQTGFFDLVLGFTDMASTLLQDTHGIFDGTLRQTFQAQDLLPAGPLAELNQRLQQTAPDEETPITMQELLLICSAVDFCAKAHQGMLREHMLRVQQELGHATPEETENVVQGALFAAKRTLDVLRESFGENDWWQAHEQQLARIPAAN